MCSVIVALEEPTWERTSGSWTMDSTLCQGLQDVCLVSLQDGETVSRSLVAHCRYAPATKPQDKEHEDADSG